MQASKTITLTLGEDLARKLDERWHQQRLGSRAETIREILRSALDCHRSEQATDSEAWLNKVAVLAREMAVSGRGVSLPEVLRAVIGNHALSDLIRASKYLRFAGWRRKQVWVKDSAAREWRFFPPVRVAVAETEPEDDFAEWAK